METIDVKVSNKTAQLMRPAAIVCDNTDYEIKFHFDEKWAAHHVKTARFYHSGKKTDVVFSGDVCAVPKMQNASGVYVGVYAGDLITTIAAYIRCDMSILSMGGSNEEPPEDVYNQLVALAGETRGIAESANASASSAVEIANAAKDTAESVVGAEQARATAEQGRSEAEAQRSEAEQARATAEQARFEAEAQRSEAEQARSTAEQGRSEAEAQRVTAEQARSEAEQSRVAAEAERLAAINAAAPSIINIATGEFITVKDAANRSIAGLKVLGKTADGLCVKAGTKIKSTGKNFVEITADSSRTSGSLTVSMSAADGSCIIDGVVDSTNSFSTTYRAKLAAGTYTASVIGLNEIDSRNDRIYVFDANSREIYINYITSRQAGTFTIAEACEVGITFVFATGSVYNNRSVSVQIEAGTEATAHARHIAGGEIETPCDLFAGDVWFPLTGVVEQEGSLEPLQYPPQSIAMCYGITNVTQTPVELSALLDVVYVADTKLYIDSKIAELINI